MHLPPTLLRPPPRRRPRGFALVDVSVATVLMVVGLLSLAQVALTIRSLHRADEEKAIAAAALQEELRAIETTPFRDLIATHHGRGFTVILDGAVTPALRALPGDADGLPGSITIEPPDPPNDPELLLEATVLLEWEASNGPQRLVRRIRIARSGANP